MIRNYLIYGGFTLLSSGVGFFITPFLSHYLSRSDFGLIGLFMIAVQLFTPIVGLSMNSIIARSYHTRTDLDALLGSGFLLILTLSAFFSALLWFVPNGILEYFGYTSELVWLALVASFFMINAATFSGVLQMAEQPVKWGFGVLINTSALVGATFFLLFVFDLGYMSRVLGIIAAQFITAITLFLFIKNRFNIKISINAEHIKYFFRLGCPLIFTALCGWAMISVDRLFIESMLGTDLTGLYVFAITLASPALIIQVTYTRVWSPRVYKALSKSGLDGVIREIFASYIGYILVGLAVSVFGSYLFRFIIDEKFFDALELIPWLVCGIVVQGIQGLLVPFMMHFEKTKIMAYGAVLGIIVNTGANYYLIPDYGLPGAAIASIMGHALISAVYIYSVWDVFFKQKFNKLQLNIS